MATMDMKDMNRWAADDWAAFALSLWELRDNIMADPAYIDAGVDILVGLRAAVPHVNMVLRKYCADTADIIADLCCERIRDLADNCRWNVAETTRQFSADHEDAQDETILDEGEGLELPPEWFDGLDND